MPVGITLKLAVDFSIVEFLLVADLAKQDCIVSFWADIEYLLFFA